MTPEGRITPACLGLWDDRTETALKDKLSRARKLAPKTPVFIQLAHAGRKASSATPWEGGQLLSKEQGGWDTLAPSAIPQLKDERLPHELSKAELAELITAFVVAAQRAERIGVDGIELHGAHGYLLHQFYRQSPTSALTNMAALMRIASAFSWNYLQQYAMHTKASWVFGFLPAIGLRVVGLPRKLQILHPA